MGESKPYSEGGTKSARERPSAEVPEEEAPEECCLNMGRRKSREMMSLPSRWAKSNLAEIVIRHSPLERNSFRTASPSDLNLMNSKWFLSALAPRIVANIPQSKNGSTSSTESPLARISRNGFPLI